MADDTGGTDALQAQIDLSMSLMHDLVSSWVSSAGRTATKTHDSRLEEELKESLRRPPRLGVGASIPDAGTSKTREAARLKGQLVGKRKRDLDEDTSLPSTEQKTTSDDEEKHDSRARAFKKKPTIDPFSTKAERKAKAVAAATPSVSIAKVTSPVTSSAAAPIPQPVIKERAKEPEKSQAASSIRAQPPPGTPLLNLDGPVGEQSSEDETPQSTQHHDSPSKKRRKRRKKKKTLHDQTAQPATSDG